MAFYHYNQNNPGGITHTTATLADQVIIEADTPAEANTKLIKLGGYFNGVDIGRDCPCCGDRWDPTSHYDASDTPMIYKKTPEEWINHPSSNFGKPGRKVVIHYKDGTTKWF